MFPLALCCVLLLGAVALGVSRLRGGPTVEAHPPSGSKPENAALEDQAGIANVRLLTIGLVIYLPLWTVVGFSATTLFGALLLLRRLGSRPLAAVVGAAALVVVVKLMFTYLFEVQLPEGYLERWLP